METHLNTAMCCGKLLRELMSFLPNVYVDLFSFCSATNIPFSSNLHPIAVGDLMKHEKSNIVYYKIN